MNRTRTRTIVGIWLLLTSMSAIACTPQVPIISDYVKDSRQNQVMFVGKVLSVNAARSTNRGTVNDILFLPSRWLRGEKQPQVVVRGESQTVCMMRFEFSAKSGEEWLIFGYTGKGKVFANVFLSVRVVDGKPPPEVRAELKQAGITF